MNKESVNRRRKKKKETKRLNKSDDWTNRSAAHTETKVECLKRSYFWFFFFFSSMRSTDSLSFMFDFELEWNSGEKGNEKNEQIFSSSFEEIERVRGHHLSARQSYFSYGTRAYTPAAWIHIWIRWNDVKFWLRHNDCASTGRASIGVAVVAVVAVVVVSLYFSRNAIASYFLIRIFIRKHKCQLENRLLLGASCCDINRRCIQLTTFFPFAYCAKADEMKTLYVFFYAGKERRHNLMCTLRW